MDVLLSVISTLVPTLSAIASLAYWLGRKFAEVNGRFAILDERVDKLSAGLNERLGRLESAFVQFSDVLLTILGSKSVLTDTEVMALRGMTRSMVPAAKSKYYTEEVRRRLIELLDKDPREYTMGDIEELENIAELIEKEGFEAKRRDLTRYSWILRYYAMAVRAVYIYPKLSKQMEKALAP
jgi:hypothetical protein